MACCDLALGRARGDLGVVGFVRLNGPDARLTELVTDDRLTAPQGVGNLALGKPLPVL
jgi:hypothetical protein